MPADPHEVHEKTNSHEVRYQLDISLIALSCFNHVSVTVTMSRFFDVTYLEKREVFGLIDRALI